MKATEGVLKDLLVTQDQEVLCLLKEAAEQEKGKYYSFMARTRFLNCSFIPQRWERVRTISYYQNPFFFFCFFFFLEVAIHVAMPSLFSHSTDLVISSFQ